MRNIIIAISAILLLCSCACQTSPAYWRTDANCAQLEAREKGKALLVLITAPDCSACESNWCRIFSRKDFLNEVDKELVPLYLSCPYQNASSVCKAWRDKYDASQSPSLLIIGSDGELIATVPFPYKDMENCLESIRSSLAK